MSAELDRRPARAVPRLGSRGSWSYTARSACVEAAESPRLAKVRRPGGVSRQAHTTRPPPGLEARSRRVGSRPKRGEVSPRVAGVERVAVVRRVGSIDLGCAAAGQKGSERFIDQRRIGQLRTSSSRTRKQLLVHGRADSHACDATFIPHLCHRPSTHGGAARAVVPPSAPEDPGWSPTRGKAPAHGTVPTQRRSSSSRTTGRPPPLARARRFSRAPHRRSSTRPQPGCQRGRSAMWNP
jgi:hypothetical protein